MGFGAVSAERLPVIALLGVGIGRRWTRGWLRRMPGSASTAAPCSAVQSGDIRPSIVPTSAGGLSIARVSPSPTVRRAVVSGSSQPMRFCDEHRPPDSAYCKRRRERLRGGDRYKREDVFERDGWICQICGLPVDPELKWPDKMAAQIDHLVPASRDGEDTLDNVRCAHGFCNNRKHAKLSA